MNCTLTTTAQVPLHTTLGPGWSWSKMLLGLACGKLHFNQLEGCCCSSAPAFGWWTTTWKCCWWSGTSGEMTSTFNVGTECFIDLCNRSVFFSLPSANPSPICTSVSSLFTVRLYKLSSSRILYMIKFAELEGVELRQILFSSTE